MALENPPGIRGRIWLISRLAHLIAQEIQRTWDPGTRELDHQTGQYLETIETLRREVRAARGTETNDRRRNPTEPEIARIIQLVDQILDDAAELPRRITEENENIGDHLFALSILYDQLLHPSQMRQ
jgi:hypothetical protein